MKKIILLAMLGMLPTLALADCKSLMKKYDAPDPATKTMNQLERWVSRKVDDPADAKELAKCLIALAADNPNKAQVAGK